MIQHRVKHLEPIHIGYTNEYKYALVTEDGSKFYPNDLVFHKSIDVMIQKLDKQDKELVSLWSIVDPIRQDPMQKGIFYLNEMEFDYYCKECLKYLETSKSEESQFCKLATSHDVRIDEFYPWARLEYYFTQLPNGFQGSVEDRKIRANWKRRAAPNGKGVYGWTLARTMVVLKLAAMYMSRITEELINLETYQDLNTGRKVILRMMCDRRVEDYDEWEICREEISEACQSILKEERTLKEKSLDLYMWYGPEHPASRRFATVAEFKKLLEELEINMNKIILVPDVHFIRHWFELPLKVNYACATVLRPDGKEYYRSIQAQLHVFERLACDIDWKSAMTKNREKTEQMRSTIIDLLNRCQYDDVCSSENVETSINKLNTDSFFAESNKRAMKSPLYICRKKKYSDSMPMTDFKKWFETHCHELTSAYQDDFWKSDMIEIWKVRYFFLTRWIDMILSDHKELSMNLKTALTMQIGFVQLNNAEDIRQFCAEIDMDRFLDYGKIKMFEEMAENSRIRKLDAPKQNVPQEPAKKDPKIMKPIIVPAKQNIENKEKATVDQKVTTRKIDEDKEAKVGQTMKKLKSQVRSSPKKTPKVEEAKNKTIDDILKKLAGYIPMAMSSLECEEFQLIDELGEAIHYHLADCFDEKEFKILDEIMRDSNAIEKLKRNKMEKFFDFESREDGKCYYKKATPSSQVKKSPEVTGNGIFQRLFGFIPPVFGSSENEEVQQTEELKNEKTGSKNKGMQVNLDKTALENEKKFNDEINILKQQLAEKSKLLEDQGNRLQSDAMQIHNLQKELREARGALAKREEDAKVMENSLKVQANKSKQDYKAVKTECHELNEKLRDKDRSIKNLETQLKEIRETVKNEQKKKKSKEDEESKKVDKNLKKMMAELEMAKITLNDNSKTIFELEKRNRGLQVELEVQKEQMATSSMDSEKNERIRELTQECEDLKLERIGMFVDIEELSARNRELENQLSLEVGTKPSTSSPFTELQNHLEDKENIQAFPSSSLQDPKNHEGVRRCLICTSKIKNGHQDVPKCEQCRNEFHNHCISKWLGVNPTCPACRKRWLDPEEYPEL